MFKVGDEVIVKTVYDMLRDGHTIKISDMAGGNYTESTGYLLTFIKELTRLCEKRFYIKAVEESGRYRLVDGDGNDIKFIWEDYMLKQDTEERAISPAEEFEIALLYE